MTEMKPEASVARRDRGLALADALLENNRRLPPLPAASHERVKRKLRMHFGSPAARRARWLRPVVVAGSLLLWGTAFGVAIDHFVLEHHASPSPQVQPAAAPAGPRAHRPRPRPAPAIAVRDDQAAPSEATSPQEIAIPALEPALPAPSKSVTTLALVEKPARPRPSHSPDPVERPAPAPVAAPEISPAISIPAAAALADPERSPAMGSTARAALPALVPEAPAPAPAAAAPAAPPAPSRPPATTVAAADGMTEERLLAAAVRSLRAKHDAPSALAALDAYQARYPQGRLFVEASVLRVDALTALHRQPEALRSLDELDLGRIPGGLERRLQRGELRAASGRLREALTDFDGVLAQAREQDLVQRALGGRTQARQRLGDLAGARSDANEYLRRFPAGPFARQARDIAQVNP
jgi:hypothetical protein